VVAEIATFGMRQQVEFPTVVESPAHRDRTIAPVGRIKRSSGQQNRGRLQPGLDAFDQLQLPEQPLHLPGAQHEQQDKGGNGEQGRPESRPKT